MTFAEEATDEMFAMVMSSHGKTFEKVNRGSRGEHPALHMLAKSGTPLTPGRISDALGVSPGRVSAILDRLEKKGLVVRETDPSNRRNVLVTITDAGREQERRLFEEIRDRFIHVFEHMGEEHTRQFIERCKEFGMYMRDEGFPAPPAGPPCNMP